MCPASVWYCSNGEVGEEFHVFSQQDALSARGLVSMLGVKFTDEVMFTSLLHWVFGLNKRMN